MEICVTRFSEATFNENRLWLKNNNSSLGCIYGTPIKVSDLIDPNTQLLVLEMNNTNNCIEGIGIVKNNLVKENRKYYKIYSINNYNRYIYKSNYRIDRKNFTSYENEIIELLPKKVVNNEEFDFVKFLIAMYKNRFVTIKNIKIMH